GEDVGVGRRVAGDGGLLAGDDVEPADAVELVSRFLRRLVALALLGDDMDEDRAVARVADIAQHRQQMVELVTVDRADIVEAELLEEIAAGPEVPREDLGEPDPVAD